jgi:hypothetical protein
MPRIRIVPRRLLKTALVGVVPTWVGAIPTLACVPTFCDYSDCQSDGGTDSPVDSGDGGAEGSANGATD